MILSAPIVSLSGRIVLRAQTEADDEALTALNNDPASMRFRPFATVRVAIEDTRALRIADAADPTCIMFNVHTTPRPGSKSEFVGVSKLYNIDRYYGNSCEFGFCMSSRHLGLGLARDVLHATFAYAFEELKIHRMTFRCTPNHEFVQSWLQRLGATFEGLGRDGSWDGNGGYQDVCHYSLLEGDWMGGTKAGIEEKILGKLEARL